MRRRQIWAERQRAQLSPVGFGPNDDIMPYAVAVMRGEPPPHTTREEPMIFKASARYNDGVVLHYPDAPYITREEPKKRGRPFGSKNRPK